MCICPIIMKIVTKKPAIRFFLHVIFILDYFYKLSIFVVIACTIEFFRYYNSWLESLLNLRNIIYV